MPKHYEGARREIVVSEEIVVGIPELQQVIAEGDEVLKSREEIVSMKKFKWVLSIILVIAIVVIVYIFMGHGIFQQQTIKSSEASLLQDNLVQLSEWTTLKYEYSNVIISRTERTTSLLGITEINYAEAIKLIEYTGYIKAGTDLSKIQFRYDDLSKKLVVAVPKSKILDNVAETENAKVEDIKGNIFSDYPTQVVFDEINAQKEQLEKEKISQGFLDEADERIRQLLTSFLKAEGYEDVVVEFF